MFKNKIPVILFSLVFFLITGVFFLLFSKTEKEDFEGLSKTRDKAHTHLSASLRTAVAPEHGDLFKVCDEMGRYDRFTASQPADLSKKELEEALELYQKCGTNFPDRRMFSYQKMEESLVEMIEELDLLKTVSQSKKDNFVRVWGLIEESVFIQAEIFASFGNIQKSYWEAEYEFRLGEITFEEREERFGELNRIALDRRELMGSERENIDVLRSEEENAWMSIAK